MARLARGKLAALGSLGPALPESSKHGMQGQLSIGEQVGISISHSVCKTSIVHDDTVRHAKLSAACCNVKLVTSPLAGAPNGLCSMQRTDVITPNDGQYEVHRHDDSCCTRICIFLFTTSLKAISPQSVFCWDCNTSLLSLTTQ